MKIIYFNKMFDFKKRKKKGFALLFAVLISSLLISIGVSIFNISIKELMVSASIRDSQLAYYAADSAMECFKYWNYKTKNFNYCSSDCVDDFSEVFCNGYHPLINVERGDNINTINSNIFLKYSNLDNNKEPVAGIEAIKTYDGNIMKTILNFFGYNTDETGRRVERYYTIEI